MVHTSGANGWAFWHRWPAGLHTVGHPPAMTFTGADEDIARLADTCFGITAADDVGYAIGQSLVWEMGREPFLSATRPGRCITPRSLTAATTWSPCSRTRCRRCGPRCLGWPGGPADGRRPPGGIAERIIGPMPALRWKTRWNRVSPRSPDR
ncbi:putative chalcone/stilbene synthase [Mycobacterium xenopi 3993]|nr:putative chalcone/stilbene synthase [Mycobacterium xenopi 3993]